ncbi:MAG: zinc-dependent alcohol dehydrogenase family protein [Planctomycetes bacterium]|jgi:propanol-preferring alcohol dehydrogenase|nr:zinc-dependent alcohol dehydrogenase family protein [Planctomycetota bacterium]
MRAMVLARPSPAEDRPLAAAELAEPRPGPGEVLIEVAACGVCHTDLHTVEGDLPLPRLPLVPGHQVVGRVLAAGPGARRHAAGDRVGVAWLAGTCGACAFCRSDRENLCAAGRFTGLHVDGGYAERMVAREDFAFPLPEGFSDEAAAPLLCAGIIGYRALRLSGAAPGGTLGLFGFGASAHVTIQVARHEGIRVFAFSRSAEHRALAARLGAEWTGSAEETPPRALDAAICFAPAGSLVPVILGHLDRGATLALAGVTMTKIPSLDYDRLLYHERKVTSVTNFTRRDAADLLELAAKIPIRTEVCVFPLAEANEALLALKHGRISGAAVLR